MVDKKDTKSNNVSSDFYLKVQEELIQAILATEGDLSEVFELISYEDFSEPEFEFIFKAAQSLSRASEVVNVYTVAKVLEENGELSGIGLKKLVTLARRGKTRVREAPVRIYAKVLKERSAKERIKTILTEKSEDFEND